jgi:hypothetical protein
MNELFEKFELFIIRGTAVILTLLTAIALIRAKLFKEIPDWPGLPRTESSEGEQPRSSGGPWITGSEQFPLLTDRKKK